MTVLTTDRLRLEPFHEQHASGLRAMNTDPEVMCYRGIERWYAVDVVTYEISRAAWNQRCQAADTTPVPPTGTGTAHK